MTPEMPSEFTLKAQASFSSGVPETVMSVAIMNSLKSMLPLPSRSKIRKILKGKERY
jgi:hypothetical protein